MEPDLRNILKGKIIIVGIGHVLKGDDAFGPELIARLEGKVKAVCVDAGTSPENYVGKIVREKPDTVLLVDAVHLGSSPGAWDILKEDDIIQSGLTTHDLSPRLFIEHLSRETSAGIFLLAVEPQQIGLGEAMSIPVQVTLDKIDQIIKGALHA